MKLLVFDMGHVFIDFEWETVCKGLCARSGYTSEQLRGVMLSVSKLGYESGLIDTVGFLTELNRQLGTELNREDFTKIWTESFRENAEMAQLLTQLKAQCPLYLLSNTNEVQYEWLQTTYNVARHFEELVLSYKVGCCKPDLAIYREVLKRSGIPAQDCLFVDDLEANIEAATTLGMNTIQFRGVPDLKLRLQHLGFNV